MDSESARAQALIAGRRAVLEAIAHKLLIDETLEREELAQILRDHQNGNAAKLGEAEAH
jgi:ATP-dependent Zn protease